MYQMVEATCTVSSPSTAVTCARESLHRGINYYKQTSDHLVEKRFLNIFALKKCSCDKVFHN